MAFFHGKITLLWNQQMFLQSELAAVLLSMAVHRCKASARLGKYKLLERYLSRVLAFKGFQ